MLQISETAIHGFIAYLRASYGLHQTGFREDGSTPWSECEVTLEVVTLHPTPYTLHSTPSTSPPTF